MMLLDPAKILTRPIRIRSAVLFVVLAAYVATTFYIFFAAVVPSFAEETTSDEFAVDSTLYSYFADSLREQRNEPWVIASMAHFPNTLWMPVFLYLLLNSAFLIMLANFAVFIVSIWLLKQSYGISLSAFLPLLLINPTTTTSLLCVNKEVFDLLTISLFLFARVRQHRWLMFVALALALLNRWEVCFVLFVFLLVESPLNPWSNRRAVTVIMFVMVLNFAMPFWAGEILAGRFEEANSGNTIAVLDGLQMHYLYIVAVIPKIAENLFGFLLNRDVWKVGSSWLLINFFNNAAFAILIVTALLRKALTLRNNLIYLGAVGAVVMAQSLAVQPRYFYFIYVLVCLQLSLPRDLKKPRLSFFGLRPSAAHA